MKPRAVPGFIRISLIVAAATLAAGCTFLQAKPDTSRYYVLATTSVERSDEPHGQIHLGVGPVSLPGYLDTQSLVRMGNGGNIQYVGGAFWAEPVLDGIHRLLLHNVGAKVGTSHAIAFPWYSTTRVDWRIPVDILRFEGTTDGRAVLVARWSVERTEDSFVATMKESSFEEAAAGDAGTIVDGLSRCLDRLSDTIAKAVIAADAAHPVDKKKRAARPAPAPVVVKPKSAPVSSTATSPPPASNSLVPVATPPPPSSSMPARPTEASGSVPVTAPPTPPAPKGPEIDPSHGKPPSAPPDASDTAPVPKLAPTPPSP